MTDSKVEQVARALAPIDRPHAAVCLPSAYDTATSQQRRKLHDMARAAIEAMREPNDYMIIEGGWHFGDATKQLPQDDYHDKKANECWRAMIDAALQESDEKDSAA